MTLPVGSIVKIARIGGGVHPSWLNVTGIVTAFPYPYDGKVWVRHEDEDFKPLSGLAAFAAMAGRGSGVTGWPLSMPWPEEDLELLPSLPEDYF